MKFISVLMVILSLVCCTSKKEYYYREGGKNEIIEARSDSEAYLIAYQKFQISNKVFEDMGKSVGNTYLEKPIAFELLNDRKEDITYKVYFENKDSLEKSISKTIRNLPNSVEVAVAEPSQAKEVSTVVKPEDFKNIIEKKVVSFEGLKLGFKSISIVNQWTFDSYGDEWRYRAAERGSKYIVAKVSISSKTNNPELPPLSVYKIQDGNVEFLGNMDYEFSRWKSYGHYLGNYADYSNDFAHSETIPFSCGLNVLSVDLEDAAIVIVVQHKGCYYRSDSQLETPTVAYRSSGCESIILDPSENGKSFTVIKIFNKKEL